MFLWLQFRLSTSFLWLLLVFGYNMNCRLGTYEKTYFTFLILNFKIFYTYLTAK